MYCMEDLLLADLEWSKRRCHAYLFFFGERACDVRSLAAGFVSSHDVSSSSKAWFSKIKERFVFPLRLTWSYALQSPMEVPQEFPGFPLVVFGLFCRQLHGEVGVVLTTVVCCCPFLLHVQLVLVVVVQ